MDVIKIDRSFVTELGQSSRGDALVESIVSLSAKLGMQTIAEGVETPAQASSLMDSGCGVAQGFLYSRPLSAEDFAAFAWNGGHGFGDPRDDPQERDDRPGP